jgi:hypothetical protein
MMDNVRDDSDYAGEFDQDKILAQALSLLDPAQENPNYWFRFRSWVLTSAAAELARRRLICELTVTDVMNSWARGVVSTAALAAALAGLMLVRGPGAPVPQPVGIEELIVSEVEGEALPSLIPLQTNGAAAFASEIF